MSTEKRVEPIREETRYAIKRKSAYSLPVNPSERGMGAQEIKKAFYAPITETASSVLSELDRVIEQTNAALDEAQSDRGERLAQAKAYADQREQEGKRYTDTENAKQDEALAELRQGLEQTQEEVSAQDARLTDAEKALSDTVLPTLADMEARKADRVSPTTTGDMLHAGNAHVTGNTVLADTAVEGTLSNARLQSAYEDIEKSKTELTALRAELSGKGRAFSLPDFSALVNFLAYGGQDTAQIYLIENGTAVYYTAADLKTGDVIYIKEIHVPDVWWVETDSEEGAYSYSYNGIDHTLIGRREYGGEIIGQVQPLETDYMVIEQHATAASVSAQNAENRALEAASAAGHAAGYAADAQRQADRAGTEQESAEQAAQQAGSFAQQAQEHALMAQAYAVTAEDHAEHAGDAAERAQGVLDTARESLRKELIPQIDRNTKRITNLEQGWSPDPFETDDTVAYVKSVPTKALPYAEVTKVGGMSYCSNNLFDTLSYTSNAAGADITEGNISGTISWNKNIKYSFDLVIGRTYVLSFDCNAIVRGGLLYWNGTSDNTTLQTTHREIAIVPTTSPMTMMFCTGSNETEAQVILSNIMLNAGDASLPYEPYFEGIRTAAVTEIQTTGTTIQISQAVQALDGYGCGVNSNCYNSIEFGEHGNAVFHKLASPKITLCGSSEEDWKKNNGWGQSGKDYFAIRLDVNNLGTGVQKCLVSSPWLFKAGDFGEYNVVTNYGWFIFYTSAITTVDEWKAYLQENPVELVFALSVPEAVDISDLITSDNLIEVEAGGTVTMVNEYGLAVPSEITYMVKEERE